MIIKIIIYSVPVFAITFYIFFVLFLFFTKETMDHWWNTSENDISRPRLSQVLLSHFLISIEEEAAFLCHCHVVARRFTYFVPCSCIAR